MRWNALNLPDYCCAIVEMASRTLSPRIPKDVQHLHDRLASQTDTLDRLNTLIEILPDIIVFKDGLGRWMTANAAAKKLFRLTHMDWHGKTGVELAVLSPEMSAMLLACHLSDETAWSREDPHVSIESMEDADGSVRYLEVTKIPLFDGTGGRRALVIIGHDVSQRVRADEELNLIAKVFRHNRQEGVIITTGGGDPRILRVNQAFTSITGYDAAEVAGKNPRFLKSGMHSPEFYARMRSSLKNEGEWSGEIWNRRKDGEVYPQLLSISAVKGAGGKVTHYIASMVDLTQFKTHEQRIHQLAFYDELTGLPNRTLFDDRIKMALANANRGEQAVALLFIDLDNFKTVNDSLGHPTGDKLLKMVAERLTLCVREGDTLARLGGDEFVLLLPGFPDLVQTSAAAATVSEKILDALSQPFWLDDHELVISPSIGIAMSPTDGENVEDIIKHADTAMYASKASGRNTYRFFAPLMDEAAKRRMAIESHLRHALEQNEITLHYQPQVDHAGHIIGAEALMRWHNHELGQIPPLEFIPLAEEVGSIVAIGDWALRTVCRQIKAWEREGLFRDIHHVAVNISARQFQRSDFVQRAHAIIQEECVAPAQLEFEITESSMMHDTEAMQARLKSLKMLGYKISVDDFGTGYSSLAYLKRFPIDVLKIDRSFVRDIGMDSYDEAICLTVINLANNLGLKTIAEGVESPAQIDFLRTHGCTTYQGFLFSHPVPAARFGEMLRTQTQMLAGQAP